MSIIHTGGLKSALPIRPAIQEQLYKDSIVVDSYAPLASQGYADRYFAGGISLVCVPIYPVNGHLSETIFGISEWFDMLNNDDRLMQVTCYEDVLCAKKSGKLGVLFMFHGASHLQGELSLLDVYYKLGIRQMMLCYTTRGLAGDGCMEPHDAGVSVFGEKLINRMNQLGILLDLTTAGSKTALEAIEISTKPCVVSHTDAYAIHPSDRNLKDEPAKELARRGGVVGISGFPAFIGENMYPTVNDYIKHIDYFVELVGIDHVCLGLDYYKMQAGIMPEAEAKAFYRQRIQSGQWNEKNYTAPPYYYPKEIILPERLPNLCGALRSHGYADEDIAKILGQNYLRVLKENLGS